jgi:RHS repeat-associated protein
MISSENTEENKKVNYFYDDNKQRIAKVGDKTDLYISQYFEVKDFAKQNPSVQSFVFAGSNRIATIESEETIFNYSDHLSSSSFETNKQGEVTSQIQYNPFGSEIENEKENQKEKSNSYTYTDQEKDSETGLMYYDSRYYNPDISRFISIDP